MAIAISLQPFRYVLKADRKLDQDLQTVFILRRLSASENAQIEDAIKFSTTQSSIKNDDLALSVSQSPGTTALEQVRVGLKGWENFKDADGNLVEFIQPPAGETTCPTANLDRISPEDRHELADAIDSGGNLSEDDAKN